MKIAAAYIRVSTDDQTELSPDSQIKQIREYAKSHDYIVPEEFIYRDDGISGRKTKNRPAFAQMIATAKSKKPPFEAILVWKFSRFARNREDSIVYKSMLKKQGIDVISISEPVGDDKMSVLIEAMIEAMDEYYSLNLSEEVTRGMLEKLSRGKCVNSAPLGYYFKDGELVIDEEKAEIVRWIYADFLDGVPIVQIARNLNAEGIKTLYGKQFENRSIEYILRNPLYCGKLRFTKGGGSKSHYHKCEDVMIVDGTHEPIIALDDWNRAAEKIQAIKAKHRKYYHEYANKHTLMLTGLLRCSTCGASLTHSADGYQCIKYIHGFCNVSHYVSQNKIHKAVIAALSDASIGDIHISPKVQKPKTTDNTAKLIAREEAKLDRVKDAYAAGIDTLEEYKENKQKIIAEIERLKSTQAQEKPAAINMEDIQAKRLSFLEMASDPEASPEMLNSALKEFIDYIVYDKASEHITIFYSRTL